jgi:hypothetical protein
MKQREAQDQPFEFSPTMLLAPDQSFEKVLRKFPRVFKAQIPVRQSTEFLNNSVRKVRDSHRVPKNQLLG